VSFLVNFSLSHFVVFRPRQPVRADAQTPGAPTPTPDRI
jgi:hypothetical protein